ncbi:uncharacterized protein ISCGN_022005 [Ixodes scapularis]
MYTAGDDCLKGCGSLIPGSRLLLPARYTTGDECLEGAVPSFLAAGSSVQSCSLQVSVQKSNVAGSILIRTVGQRSVLKQRAVPSFLAAGSSVQPCTPQGTTASKGAVPSSLAAGSFFQPGTPQGTSASKVRFPHSWQQAPPSSHVHLPRVQ